MSPTMNSKEHWSQATFARVVGGGASEAAGGGAESEGTVIGGTGASWADGMELT
ncbi:MAG: hypothetical protein V3R84_03440 [Acidimicrobiia bacterium]